MLHTDWNAVRSLSGDVTGALDRCLVPDTLPPDDSNTPAATAEATAILSSSCSAQSRHLIDVGGILGAFKRRLFYDVIDKIDGGYDKILICDSAAATAVSSVTRMHELIDHGVTLVEDLFLARQPLIASPAIYLLSTDECSVQRVLDDWQRKAMYREVHIFFLSVAPDKVIQKLASEPRLVAHLKTLKDVMLDFMTNESLLFHLGMQSDMSILFSQAAYTGRTRELVLEQSAARLISVLRALQSGLPHIRFQRSSAHAEYTARALWRHIQHVSQRSGELGVVMFGGRDSGNGGGANNLGNANDYDSHNNNITSSNAIISNVERPVLIIVDRSFDLAAPLVHENTYQCLLEDLMPLDANGSYEHTYTDRSGRTVTRSVVLDESDSYWCAYRHRAFSECLEAFGRLLRELIDNNPALAAGIANTRARAISPSSSSAGMSTSSLPTRQLRELGSAVRGLAEFQEAQAKLSLHAGICAKISQKYNVQRLLRVTALERQILQYASSSSHFRSLFDSVRQLVSDMDLPEEVRRRVLLLFVAVNRSSEMTEAKQQRLLQEGHLMHEAALCVHLSQLMQSGHGGKGVSGAARTAVVGEEGENGCDALHANSSTLPTLNHTAAIEGSTQPPSVVLGAFRVLEAAAQGTLTQQDFPLLSDDQSGLQGSSLNQVQLHQGTAVMAGSTNAAAAAAAPVRRTLRMGLTRTSPMTPQTRYTDTGNCALNRNNNDCNNDNKDERTGDTGAGGAVLLNLRHEGTIPLRSTQKVILFVLGGVTFGEARSAYEVSAHVGKECIVGGTSILRPASFVAQLRTMS